MAIIRQDNIIVSLDVIGRSNAKKKLEETRNEIVGINEAGEDLQKTMVEAFEVDVVNDYIKVLQDAGVEIEDIDAASEGITKRLRETFDTSNPEKYADALSKVSFGLSTGEINSTNFVDALKNLDKKQDGSERKARSFFGNLPNIAKKGLASVSAVVAAAGVAIASAIAGIFVSVGAAVVGVFNRAVDRVPSVKKNFEDLQKELRRMGDYVAAQLAPIFNRLLNIAKDFIDNIDITLIVDAFNSFFFTVESLVTSFSELIGLDIEGFGESTAGTFNGLAEFFIDFNRQLSGFGSAFQQLLGQIEFSLKQFVLGSLEALNQVLPGQQFGESIAALALDLNRLADELLPSVGVAFQVGINDFNRKLEAAQSEYDDFELFRGFDDDAEKIDDVLKTAVGSIQFYRDQIQALKNDADRTSPEVAARLLEVVDGLEEGLANAEREIEQRLDNLRGIIASPLGEVQPIQSNLQVESLADEVDEATEVIERLDEALEANAEKRRLAAESQQAKVLENIDEIAELINGIDSLFNSVADSFGEAIDRQIEKLDELVDAQEGRVERATTLAERGNAEILQLEEQRLDQLLEARERSLQRERQIAAAQLAVNQGIAVSQGIVAITRSFAEGNIIGGIAAGIALTGSLAAIVITLSDAFSNIPTFFKGTERVPGGKHDMTLIGVHGQERVLNADHNSQIDRGHSNAKVIDLYNLGRMVEESPARAMILAENGRIDTNHLVGGESYDYARLEQLLKSNTEAIWKMNKKLGTLSPNIIIPQKDIHRATTNVERNNRQRKAILK